MDNKIDSIINRIVTKNNSNKIWLLRRGVYLAIFLYFIPFFPDLEYFFGENSFQFGYRRDDNWVGDITRLLFNEIYSPYYLWFFGGFFFSLLIGCWQPFVRPLNISVYFFAANLFSKQEYISNSSTQVASILLIYLLFMAENKIDSNKGRVNFLNKLITNVVFIIAQLQICMVYFVAGIYKISGVEWITGNAFYYIISSDLFSHPIAKELFLQSDWLLYVANYFALGYQLVFIVFVWIKPIKKWFLLAGVCLHLGIIFINGVADFGIIMLVSYALFINEKTASAIRNKFKLNFFSKKLNSVDS